MILNSNFTVHPTVTFKKELQSIINYIKNVLKEPLVADKLYKSVIQKISKLKHMPERCSKVTHSTNKFANLRRLQINKYIIIYEVNNSTRASFYSTYFSWKSKLFKSFIKFYKY